MLREARSTATFVLSLLEIVVAHAKRLLELIKQIGVDVPYDCQVMELAAYMHDWGAFPKYIKKNVEHAIRSRQIVEMEILPRLESLREGIEARYAAGDVDLSEALLVRRDSAAGRLRHLEALRDAMLAWAELRPFIKPLGTR